MAGPHCESCKHYQAHPIVNNTGDCTDPTKILYAGSGAPVSFAPEVRIKNYCTNHQPHIAGKE